MGNFINKLNHILNMSEAAAPAAPIAPPRTVPTRPSTPSPSKPSPKPFNPPKPKTVPAPKNKRKRPSVFEAYDDEVSGNLRNYWTNRDRRDFVSQHPILGMYGDSLSRSSFEHTKGKASRHGNTNFGAAKRVFQQIMQLEHMHEEELEQLAKDVVCQVWGVPEEILNAQLTRNVDVGSSEEMPEPNQLSPEHVPHINKRMTLNLLAHGSAVNIMLSAHHLVSNRLNEIDERLVELYDKLSSLAHLQYWQIDWTQFLGNLGMHAVGSTKVEYDDDEPKIVAKAFIFPVLVQELSKGVSELISHHGLSDLDADTTKSVLHHADDIKHEPAMIQTGPELWRKLLKIKPREMSLADMKMKLSYLPHNKLHKLFSAIMDDDSRAKRLFTEYMSDED